MKYAFSLTVQTPLMFYQYKAGWPCQCLLTDQKSYCPCYCNEDIKLSLYISCGPQFTVNDFIMTVGRAWWQTLWHLTFDWRYSNMARESNGYLCYLKEEGGPRLRVWWKSIQHSPISCIYKTQLNMCNLKLKKYLQELDFDTHGLLYVLCKPTAYPQIDENNSVKGRICFLSTK